MRNQVVVVYTVVALLMMGCLCIDLTSPSATSSPDPPSTWTPTIPVIPEATLDPTQEFFRSCVGWDCSLEGIVYAGRVAAGNELEGITVRLTQHSNCSPTRGEYEATTGATGEFGIQVYLHDTDTFWIEVEADGYEPIRQTIGGFDCLYCSCTPIEVVLRSVE
jgi:hypothetical protein